MTVLVAYVPTPEGDAAFTAAVEEAGRRSGRLVLLNTPREGAPVSAAMADEDAVRALVERGATAGVDVEVHQEPHTGDVAAEVVRVAFGDGDAVSVGDYHHKNVVAWALAGEARGTDERMLELLEPFRGHRGRVVAMLGMGGYAAPRFGPRMPVRSFARF